MKKLTLEQCIKYLNDIKAQSDKDHELSNLLYERGIDTINYESNYQSIAIELLAAQLGTECRGEDIEWWLYEDVEKIYWLKDGTELSMKTTEDFCKYYYEDSPKQTFTRFEVSEIASLWVDRCVEASKLGPCGILMPDNVIDEYLENR